MKQINKPAGTAISAAPVGQQEENRAKKGDFYPTDNHQLVIY
jgi:hypothetical protein